MTESEFAFTVSTHPRWLPDGEIVDVFAVELPHQCDEWEVVASASRAEAFARLEQFVSEALVALGELADVQPCDHEWGPETPADWDRMVKRECPKCEAGVWRTRTQEERLGPEVVAAAKAAR